MALTIGPLGLNNKKMNKRQCIAMFSAHLIYNGEWIELFERRQKPSCPVVCTLSGLLRIHRRRGQGWEALFVFDLTFTFAKSHLLWGQTPKETYSNWVPPPQTQIRRLECRNIPVSHRVCEKPLMSYVIVTCPQSQTCTGTEGARNRNKVTRF